MTKYHGGKKRLADRISKSINDFMKKKFEDYHISGYCEPFFGMGSVMRKIIPLLGENKKYLGGDYNKSVILMWKGIQQGWKPNIKKMTKKNFNKLKSNGIASREKGFIGHFNTFMGVYFASWDNTITDRKKHTAIKRIVDTKKDIKLIKFSHGSYDQFSKLKDYIIYCDPPYEIVSRYYAEDGTLLKFDNAKFWRWCEKMSKNNYVFVTEYSYPPKYIKYKTLFNNKITSNKSEKLYFIE
jgi:site-specific DNA-adenine methylase